MFVDTHCHIFSKYDNLFNLKELITELKSNNFTFIMDIGTEAGDLKERKIRAKKAYNPIPEFIHFTAGIWPDAYSIHNPEKTLSLLEQDIQTELNSKANFFALGECGLDRYWNGANALKHENKAGTTDTVAEEALFKSQIEMAKKIGIGVVVHSRDAFEQTIKCIDAVGYNRGVIHCYSYGAEEVKAFTKRGWHISLSGTCTFPTTKTKKDKMADLIKQIPYNKLLLETDSPFLTPAPHRGKTNTPILIQHTYELVAKVLDISTQDLIDQVLTNTCDLFKVN